MKIRQVTEEHKSQKSTFDQKIERVDISNQILTELFDSQPNVVSMEIDGEKRFLRFNKEKTILKKVTQYGSLIAVGTLLFASLIPQLQEYGQSFALGAIISSLMSIFGSGRMQS